MCHNSRIISNIKNGELSICNGCDIYSLTFNNIFFQFNKEQLLQFRKYIYSLDIDYWLDNYSCTAKKRKIPVTTFHQNLVLIFNEEEIEDLKLLLLLKENPSSNLSVSEIDYTLILN